jgi:hypothetical protein
MVNVLGHGQQPGTCSPLAEGVGLIPLHPDYFSVLDKELYTTTAVTPRTWGPGSGGDNMIVFHTITPDMFKLNFTLQTFPVRDNPINLNKHLRTLTVRI